MIYEPNFGLVEQMMKKPKFRINWNLEFQNGGFYLTPLNYAAETIFLMKIYGRTDTGRRFKP